MKPSTIIRANTALRKEPARLTKLMAVLPKGENVIIINDAPITNGYVNIELNNKVTGWVMKECLSEFASNSLGQVHKQQDQKPKQESMTVREVPHDSETDK